MTVSEEMASATIFERVATATGELSARLYTLGDFTGVAFALEYPATCCIETDVYAGRPNLSVPVSASTPTALNARTSSEVDVKLSCVMLRRAQHVSK